MLERIAVHHGQGLAGAKPDTLDAQDRRPVRVRRARFLPRRVSPRRLLTVSMDEVEVEELAGMALDVTREQPFMLGAEVELERKLEQEQACLAADIHQHGIALLIALEFEAARERQPDAAPAVCQLIEKSHAWRMSRGDGK
ncbi:hypothetical protein [Archangium gephyra]|uniref:hypothetical protein n=1 Tax=Archangium gephyra TaxID=48 RepID=UPI001476D743|nr:hypothetical protein [Archangium gephyra]